MRLKLTNNGLLPQQSNHLRNTSLALSAGAVEYTDCISAGGGVRWPITTVLGMTQVNLIVRL